MNESLKKLIANKKLVSYGVLNWVGTLTKGEICGIIGFTRPTLERRLKLHNWELSEIKKIIKKLPF
jgi:hypothetical protein